MEQLLTEEGSVRKAEVIFERGQQGTRHGLEVGAFSSSFLTPGLTRSDF